MSSEAIKRLASPSTAMKALKWRNKIMADFICPSLQDTVKYFRGERGWLVRVG